MKNQIVDIFQNEPIEYFISYNERYKTDPVMRYTEATMYDLDAMRKWISIRDQFTYVHDENTEGNWEYIGTTGGHRKKYGINYIYVEPVKKLWRYMETASEFYGEHGKAFKF